MLEKLALKELLDSYINAATKNDSENTSTFLKLLNNSAKQNGSKNSSAMRYSENLKQFASYIFIKGGRSVYETLAQNLSGSLPSTSTVSKNVITYNKPIKGDMRFAELNTYLTERSLPKIIWISEDGTRITGKIQYNERDDQISGFVLPFDSNGLPKTDFFPAENYEVIKEYFATAKIGNYAYVIMAQPLDEGVAPFCLSFFSSNNKFTNEPISLRWDWMVKKEVLKVSTHI